jgi:hypothetical protein
MAPAYGDATPPPAPRKSGIGKKIGAFAGVIAVALVIAAVKFGLFTGISAALGLGDDKAAEAKVGDCIASLPEVAEGQQQEANDAKVVTCDSADAKYAVVGRLENQTATQAASNDVCNPYKEATYWYSAIPENGKGYVLCLKPTKSEEPAKKKK